MYNVSPFTFTGCYLTHVNKDSIPEIESKDFDLGGFELEDFFCRRCERGLLECDDDHVNECNYNGDDDKISMRCDIGGTDDHVDFYFPIDIHYDFGSSWKHSAISAGALCVVSLQTCTIEKRYDRRSVRQINLNSERIELRVAGFNRVASVDGKNYLYLELDYKAGSVLNSIYQDVMTEKNTVYELSFYMRTCVPVKKPLPTD